MTKVAILGAAGRMGRMLIRFADQMKDVEVAAAIEQAGNPEIGKDAGLVAGIRELGVAITPELKAVAAADVMIDFTFHAAAPANVRAAAEAGRAVVLGTTGLTDDETERVKAEVGRIPILWAPNMSLGVNLLFSLVEKASAVLGMDYDIEVVEMHHRHKKDSPSGTALRLAEKAASGRGQDFRKVANYGREGIVGERPKGQIAIHAVRGGDIVGDHTVIMANDGERIELGHRATSREAFATGALRAAVWIKTQRPGLYSMQDMLGL